MASSSTPQDSDDTAFLIIIFALVVLLLGLAPVVVDMYLETRIAVAELRDEKKNLQKVRREMEQQLRKDKEQ